VIRTRSAPGFGSARSRSRRGLRLLHVLGWTTLLAGAAYFGVPAYLQRMQPPPLRDEPKAITFAVPVTDVADFEARRGIIGFRDAVRHEFGEDQALFDTCREGDGDEVRLTHADAWGRDAFTVWIRGSGDAATARWLRIETIVPPPPPPPPLRRVPGIRFNPAPAPEVPPKPDPLEATRPLTAAAWSSLRMRVLDPAFLRVPTANRSGLDGFMMFIESCTAGHYHFVSRWGPHPPEDVAFLRVADAIITAAGGVHDYTHYEIVDPRPATAPTGGR